MIRDVAELFAQPVLGIWGIFVSYVPNVSAALIFILFGLFAARLLSSLLETFLHKIKFDSYVSRVGINEVMTRFGFGKSAVAILSFLVYWSIILVFLISAAESVNLHAIPLLLKKTLFVFVPRIVTAVFIAYGGLLFSGFMSNVVLNSAATNNLRGGKALSKIVNLAIMVFTTIAAVEQLGIEMKIIRSGIDILFASLGLAFAIAAGLGGKDIAQNIIRGLLTEYKDEK